MTKAMMLEEQSIEMKSDHATRVDEIVAYLRSVQRYEVQDLLNKYVPQSTGEVRALNLAIWEAREQLRRSDGIVFGPLRGFSGVFERKDAKQIVSSAERQRCAGTRKHRRAEEKLRLASSLTPDQVDKQRISDAADRIALRIAMRRKA